MRRDIEIFHQVGDQRMPGFERLVCQDGAAILVARRRCDAPATEAVTPEFSFDLGEAVELADACFGGNARALTTPGLARILCASVLVLFKAALSSGAIIKVDRAQDELGNRPDDQNRNDAAQGGRLQSEAVPGGGREFLDL